MTHWCCYFCWWCCYYCWCYNSSYQIASDETCEEDDGVDGANDDGGDDGGGVAPGQDDDGRGRIVHVPDDTCQCHRQE